MKPLYFSLLFFTVFFAQAQAQDKIVFDYDAAGNQTQRRLCANCTDPTKKQVGQAKELLPEDWLPSPVSDKISYYPNPVQQELYLSWQVTDLHKVVVIQTFDLNGRLLQSLQGLESENQQTVSFGNYPSGLYLVVLTYSNGDKKTLEIIKK